MDTPASGVLRWRKPVYIVLGILGLVMIAMSLVQVWVLLTFEDPVTSGAVSSTGEGLPDSDQRGAYIRLNPGHKTSYSTNLVKLLTTTQAGVIDESNGAHLKPSDIESVIIQSSNISAEIRDYRLYIIADQEEYPMSYERLEGGKTLFIRPSSGVWKVGPYQVDVPKDGMFGGRDYYQFYIDPE